MLHRFLLLLAGLAALAGTPVFAAEKTESTTYAASDPAYLKLFEAMGSGFDQNAAIDRQLEAIVNGISASNPEIARLASADATFRGRFKAVVQPFMVRHAQNVLPLQQREMAALMARHLSPTEAMTWVNFYNSPLGRKAVGTAQDNTSYATTTNAMLDNGSVGAADIQRDMARTMRSTDKALAASTTLDEQRQMLLMMRKPSYAKLLAMVQELPAVRARLEMTPMEPSLAAEGQAAIAAFLLEAQGVKVDPAEAEPTG